METCIFGTIVDKNDQKKKSILLGVINSDFLCFVFLTMKFAKKYIFEQYAGYLCFHRVGTHCIR